MTSPYMGWLLRQRTRHDPVGDLARDAWRDTTLPVTLGPDEFHDYLENRVHAVPLALAASDAARLEFDRFVQCRADAMESDGHVRRCRRVRAPRSMYCWQHHAKEQQ